jgi:hypothetical protein
MLVDGLFRALPITEVCLVEIAEFHMLQTLPSHVAQEFWLTISNYHNLEWPIGAIRVLHQVFKVRHLEMLTLP